MKHLKVYESFINEIYDISSDSRYKNLSSISNIPDYIVYFRCDGNQITSLPKLPKNLKEMNCSSNRLISLPKLPDTLRRLFCYHNKLKALPELPEGLLELNCSNNMLTSLPKLPEYLDVLYCSSNPLECLIPFRFLGRQGKDWASEYYFPYIGSYKGQKKILTDDRNNIEELKQQTAIHPKIKKEFGYLFSGTDLNLL